VQNTLKNNKPGFRLDLGYSNVADRFKLSEARVGGKFRLNVPVQEDLSFGLLANAAFLARKYNTTTTYRNLIKFQPYVRYRYQDLDIMGGINTAIQNDTISQRGSVLLYPVVDLAYHISDSFTGFLKFDGDMQEVSMHNISEKNPYLQENVPLYHTDKKFGLDWGIKANLGNIAFFKAGFNYSSFRDMYYFLNDSLNIAKFNLIYDRGTTNLTNVYGELNLSKPGLYMVNLKAAYYKYKTGEIAVPWHRPAWTVDLISRYDIYNKIILSADLYFKGGIRAEDFNTGEVITLSPVSDINFTIDYLFSRKFSVFLDFRNILGKNYELYWRYPSRGIQFMAGVSVTF
jgi:hypothetical protein